MKRVGVKKYRNLKLKRTSPIEAGERKRRVGRVSKQTSGKASSKPFVAVRSSFVVCKMFYSARYKSSGLKKSVNQLCK
jgi:hypothetical protein